MTDKDWTAEDSYRILRDAIDQFTSGDVSATRLYDWLNGTYGVPKDTPPIHRANRLWGQVVLNGAVYLQCDFERSVLEESLRMLAEGWDRGEIVGFTAITRSRCFMEMVKNGTVPQPLQVATPESLHWRRMRFEGFREL